MTSRRTALAAALVALIALPAAPALAQAWPTKPVKLLVGSPPGGPSDITSRLIGEALTKRTGQPVVVENRPGANGQLGMQAVARAAPTATRWWWAASRPRSCRR